MRAEIRASAVVTPLVSSVVTGRAAFWSRSPSPEEVVADAARAGSSRVSVAFDAAGEGDGPTASSYRIEGTLDYRRNAGRFVLDLAGMDEQGTLDKVEVVKSPSALFVRPRDTLGRTGEAMAEVGQPGHSLWHGARRPRRGPPYRHLRDRYGPGEFNETMQGQMDELATDVERASREPMRGEPTTRYHLILDGGALGLAASPDSGGMVTGGTADVWVDGRGRARQIRMSLGVSVSDGEVSGSGTGTYTMEFFDFGVAVDLAEPPDDEVVVAGRHRRRTIRLTVGQNSTDGLLLVASSQARASDRRVSAKTCGASRMAATDNTCRLRPTRRRQRGMARGRE